MLTLVFSAAVVQCLLGLLAVLADYPAGGGQ